MTLADAVRLALVEPPSWSRPQHLEPRLARAAAAVAARMERIGTLEPVDLAALRRRLDRVPELSALGPRDFKHVAHLLWEAPALGADHGFVQRYLAELRRRASGPALRRLALLWLLNFAPTQPAIAEVARLLRDKARPLRGALANPDIARRIFDPVTGPATLADELARDPAAPAAVLERHGLKGPAAEGGFVLASFRALLGVLGQAMAGKGSSYLPLLQRILAFSRNEQGTPRFDQARAALADTLLRPFVVEEPPPEVRKIIEIELLNRLDDPRLAAGRWAGVSETAKEVMLRWLAEATLEAFIAIVRKYADPGHWVYREAFWRAYLRAGYVRSVQVAFKPLAAQEARHMARHDKRLLAFAELSGSGTLASHAVLLLRIGDLTLAEWSHNGALRIWRAGNPRAPRLTGRHFDGAELKVAADLRVVHHPQGRWQAEVASFVWRMTGLRVQESDYMPRSR